MPSEHDDSRLTAYALGELEDFERSEIEALIADDFEAKALVEEIRATARLLADEFKNEAKPGLALEHRQAIETRLDTPELLEMPKPRKASRSWGKYAIAAGLLGLSATLIYRTSPSISSRFTSVSSTISGRNDYAMAPAPALKSASPAEASGTVDFFDDDVDAPARSSSETRIGRLAQATGPAPAEPKAVAPTTSTQAGKYFKDDVTYDAKARFATPAPGYVVNPSLNNSLGNQPSNAMNAPAQPYGAEASLQPGQVQPGQGQGQNQPGQNQSDQAPAKYSMTPDSVSVDSSKLPSAETNRRQAAAQAPGQMAKKSKLQARAEPLAASKPGSSNHPSDSTVVAEGLALRDAKPKAEAQDLRAQIDAIDRELYRVPVLAKQPTELLIAERDRQRALQEHRQRLQERLDNAQGGDAFNRIVDNAFLSVEANPLSTFSIDVDTASYANVRRYLTQNTRPPVDAVRIEELINYFPYSYPQPKGDDPFSVNLEVARCPWDASHRLVRIGLKGREIDNSKRPPSNLVFLIDVSGSMNQPDKLPLLKAGMKLLVDQLGENDRVAIVVYAASEGMVLSSTNGSQREKILSSLEELQAGGSTNGGRGIMLAYDIAVQSFIKGGTNRVILATDGDFNVGVTEGPDLDRLIEAKRATGVSLSVLGFGQGNVKHDKLENLADKGNGQYSYIDTIKEARKVLVEQGSGTLVTIAKDVKIQVKFNPAHASSYRLIGYENRMLQAQDFANDKKDAGEIGAGHCVTALYEVVPPGLPGPNSEPVKLPAAESPELLNVDLRFKAPDGDVSKLISFSALDRGGDFSAASNDYRFAASVAGFGMLLRNSPYKGTLTWPGLVEMARGATGDDAAPYRKEFLKLVIKAQSLDPR